MGAILQSPCPSVRSHFRDRYLSFYWKKWFYIWYMALAWRLVLCLLFPGLPHIYFLFTVRLTNECVGVFLAWRSVQHLVTFSVVDTCFVPHFTVYNQIISNLYTVVRNILNVHVTYWWYSSNYTCSHIHCSQCLYFCRLWKRTVYTTESRESLKLLLKEKDVIMFVNNWTDISPVYTACNVD